MRAATLRLRLALLGLALVLVPLAVLLAVTFSTEEEATRRSDGTGVEEVTTGGVSPWVTLTALALTLPAGVVAWWWAGRAVEPLSVVTRAADDIQYGSLDRRIGLSGAPAEVQALADSFDRMLDRLAAASTVQQRLIEDTGHQLRTPLAALVTNVDLLLTDPGPASDEHRAGLERTRRAVGRLESTVDELLATARADHLRTLRTGNDLVAIARAVADDRHDAAAVRHVTIAVEGPVELRADVDPPAVRRAVTNLVDNALRFSPTGGTVAISVAADGDRASVAVTDRGPGIDPEIVDRVFERYWRGDERGRGIGLAIVQQVADAHGGVEITVPDGGGTRVTLWFRR